MDMPQTGKVADDPQAPPAPDVDACTVRRAVETMLERLKAPEMGRAVFPWPGGATSWPAAPGGGSIGADDLCPADAAVRALEAWDRLWRLVGPMFTDRVAVLTARPGRGKSAFALQVAEASASAGQPVLYASAEMGTDELVARLLTLRAQGGGEAGVAYSVVLRGGAPIDSVAAAGAVLASDCPGLYLWAPRGEERTPGALVNMARAVVEREGRPVLLVVDYLQRFVNVDDDERRQATAALSGALRELARPADGWPGMAVLAVSSTARTYYDLYANRASLLGASDDEALEGTGKETGEIEYDAPLLLALAADLRDAEAGGDESAPVKALVAVVKNRHGRRGVVCFNAALACGRFTGLKSSVERGELERLRAEVAEARSRPRRGNGNGKPARATRVPTTHAATSNTVEDEPMDFEE